MPIRTNVGSGDGVTSASISARDQQHDDQAHGHRDHGTALLGEHLAARPVARRDHRPAQPHAGGARQEHRRQFEQPVRGEQTQQHVGLAGLEHQPGDHARGWWRSANSTNGIGRPSRTANAMHLSGHPRVVHPHLQRERRGGMLAVVRREVVVDQFVDLAWCSDRGLHLRAADDPQRDQHHHDEERHRRRQPPPPGAVGDHRERHRPEPGELTPQRRVGTGHRRTRPRDQAREPADQHGIGRRRAHHRQVRRHPLVEVDEFVDLRAASRRRRFTSRSRRSQVGAVRQHERVDIHLAES